MRNRTVGWMEGQILKVLTTEKVIKSYLSLSALILKNVRSIEEQCNLDIAVENLKSQKVVKCSKDNEDGMSIYFLAA